jgi:hypothetical protein
MGQWAGSLGDLLSSSKSSLAMMLSEFDLVVDYSQIFVLLASLAKRVVEWTDEHVAQGFAGPPRQRS